MSQDYFRPPDHLSPLGKIGYRLLCWVSFIIIMGLFSHFVLPLVYQYVSLPLGDLVDAALPAWIE